MTPVKKLKPCPFCGNFSLLTETEEVSGYIVSCLRCGARSGIGGTQETAEEKWNRRAEPSRTETDFPANTGEPSLSDALRPVFRVAAECGGCLSFSFYPTDSDE